MIMRWSLTIVGDCVWVYGVVDCLGPVQCGGLDAGVASGVVRAGLRGAAAPPVAVPSVKT